MVINYTLIDINIAFLVCFDVLDFAANVYLCILKYSFLF